MDTIKDKIQTWFVEVFVKTAGNKLATSAISAFIVFMAAHQDLMEQMGITYYPDFNGIWSGKMPTGRLLVIEFDTLQLWGAVALGTLVVFIVAILQHHAVAAVTGKPQSGDLRIVPTPPIAGGERKEDPPAQGGPTQ